MFVGRLTNRNDTNKDERRVLENNKNKQHTWKDCISNVVEKSADVLGSDS